MNDNDTELYDVTVYYTETDTERYDNVRIELTPSETIMILVSDSGMETSIPVHSIRKLESSPAGADVPGAQRTCDRCGRVGVRGFVQVRGATICTTKGCELKPDLKP